MDQMVNQYVDTLFANMKSFSQEDGLIGKPVVQGDKTFLPVISITFGFGGGDSQSKANMDATAQSGKKGFMMGDAMGLGAKLCTDAVLVIDQGNVLIAPMNSKNGVTQMLDKIPSIVSNMNSGSQQNQQQGQQQNQQQNQ